MPSKDHLVYWCDFTKGGEFFRYIGLVGLLQGQSDEAAKTFRKKWHVLKPVAWLKGADSGSVVLHTVQTKLSLRDGLVEEAREAARQYRLHGQGKVRGGPWCRRRLPDADRREIEAVLECTSRKAVEALGARFPQGSLAAHLAGRSYSKQEVVAGTTPEGGYCKTPLYIRSKPRASGRHPPGTKKPSGRHRPGTRRMQRLWQTKAVCPGRYSLLLLAPALSAMRDLLRS